MIGATKVSLIGLVEINAVVNQKGLLAIGPEYHFNLNYTLSCKLGYRGGSGGGSRAHVIFTNNTTHRRVLFYNFTDIMVIPFKRVALFRHLTNVTTKRYLLSERRRPRIDWRRASFCKSITTTFQNRLPLWTVSLALEPADFVLYFKTKCLETKR